MLLQSGKDREQVSYVVVRSPLVAEVSIRHKAWDDLRKQRNPARKTKTERRLDLNEDMLDSFYYLVDRLGSLVDSDVVVAVMWERVDEFLRL